MRLHINYATGFGKMYTVQFYSFKKTEAKVKAPWQRAEIFWNAYDTDSNARIPASFRPICYSQQVL